MTWKPFLFLLVLVCILAGCGGRANAKIASVEYVESINAGGVYYEFEGKDNIKITLDFNFDEDLAPDLDPESDEYRKELYAFLIYGAHLYYEGQEVESVWGYWPDEVGSDYAKEMIIFYVVPDDHSSDSLRFVYEGSVLGEGASGIDTLIDP